MQPDNPTRMLMPLDDELAEGDELTDHLSLAQISQVMNPERLAALLAQAEAFGVVNSEALDDF